MKLSPAHIPVLCPPGAVIIDPLGMGLEIVAWLTKFKQGGTTFSKSVRNVLAMLAQNTIVTEAQERAL
jgi:hypothetical protein